MIKGLLALFTSGILFNPVVFLGVLSGMAFAFWVELPEVKNIYSNYHFYLLVLALSIIYNLVFKQIYKDKSATLNYSAMALNVVAYVGKFLLANALTISFVYMLKP